MWEMEEEEILQQTTEDWIWNFYLIKMIISWSCLVLIILEK